MTIIFNDGTITTTTSEQTISDITADEHFAMWIFAHNMASGDSMRIRIYVLDQNSSNMRVYDDITLSGVQSSPAYFIPFVPAKQWKVTIQRTAGSDRAFTWLRAEVS